MLRALVDAQEICTDTTCGEDVCVEEDAHELHRTAAKPAVFFAGGIGITPFRSIVKDATERRLAHRMTLFHANRTPASTAFLPEFEAWQHQNPGFRLVATVADPAGAGVGRSATVKLAAAWVVLRIRNEEEVLVRELDGYDGY